MANLINLVKTIFKNGQGPYVSDTNLNKMQDDIETAINESAEIAKFSTKILVTTTEEIAMNTAYTVPQKYHVGKNDMWIFWEGTLLIKDDNYIETGTGGTESTTIQFKDWDMPAGSKLEFLYK